MIHIAFAGNPNCGKTTLFNAFTGANLKVANWPGVTVERKEGITEYKGQKMKLIDLPGIYSLSSYSIEERVSRACILDEEIDVIINVVDASSLERNLYLTMQLLEMGKPVILALNMMDIVHERGMEIDLHRLPELLGSIPVVPVSARKRTGLDVLLHAVKHHYEEGPKGHMVTYPKKVENEIGNLKAVLKKQYPELKNLRWHALKLLEQDEEIAAKFPVDIKVPAYEKEIINEKYNYIEEILEECLFYKKGRSASTDKIDAWLTHRIWGIPIFLGIMAAVFFLTFFIGDGVKEIFENVLDVFSAGTRTFLEDIGVSQWLVSMVVDGIITGVGGILTFLPNIAILFLALALLEDSGYMARVAYVMDGIMGKAGLSGKAFLPMVLGFGCTVPAIMATRSLEEERDRKKTIFIAPFMSCSARLPIYILFSGMFFGSYATVAAFSLYALGVLTAIGLAVIMGKLDRKRGGTHGLLIELPEYKSPNARTIFIYVWEKIKHYISKAGTTIFLASIVIWFVLNYNGNGMTTDVSQSFGAVLGRWLEPVLRPAGLGQWQTAVALISGISAKEVVVTSIAVLYGIGNPSSDAGMAQLSGVLAANGFSAVSAYAFMVFCLLYVPCAATIGVIKKETNSTCFTILMIAFQIFFAWLMAVLVYQVGIRIF